MAKCTVTCFSGEVVSTTAFVQAQYHRPAYQVGHFRLMDGNSEAEKTARFKAANFTGASV